MSSQCLINIYIDIYLCSYALTQRLTIRLVVLHAQHTFKYTYKYMNTIPFNKSIFRISLVNLYKHYVLRIIIIIFKIQMQLRWSV